MLGSIPPLTATLLPTTRRFLTGAKNHMDAAARWGLFIGYEDGSFQLRNDATRAEAVTMLERLLALVK